MTKNQSWDEFWNSEHRIYVSKRHKDVHYQAVARDAMALLPDTRPLTMLDFGCGEALAAPEISRHAVTVFLYDPIPNVHKRIKKFFQGTEGVRVVDSISELPEHSLHVILVNSVLQYMSKEECKTLLPVLKRLLIQNGRLIIADVVPSGVSSFADVVSLLRNGARYGFLLSAVKGLITTFFSNYRTVRREAGFSTYTEAEFHALLSRAGFSATRIPNIGLTPHRMTFVAI